MLAQAARRISSLIEINFTSWLLVSEKKIDEEEGEQSCGLKIILRRPPGSISVKICLMRQIVHLSQIKRSGNSQSTSRFCH